MPVNDELLQAIKTYRQFLGKLPYPLSDDDSPIIIDFTQTKSLSQRHINLMIHRLGHLTSIKFIGIPDKVERLSILSAHTFRHIYALLQDMSDISLTHIRDNLGHSNITTTSIYLHSTDIARHNELQKISLPIANHDTQIIYRAATPSDAMGIALVHVNTWKVTYKDHIPETYLATLSVGNSAEFWNKAISRNAGGTQVAIFNGNVIGFVSYGKLRGSESDHELAEIYAIYVESKFWRKGIGRKLLILALEKLKTAGYKQAIIDVLKQNISAQIFYEYNGFRNTLEEKLFDLAPGVVVTEFSFTREL